MSMAYWCLIDFASPGEKNYLLSYLWSIKMGCYKATVVVAARPTLEVRVKAWEAEGVGGAREDRTREGETLEGISLPTAL